MIDGRFGVLGTISFTVFLAVNGPYVSLTMIRSIYGRSRTR